VVALADSKSDGCAGTRVLQAYINSDIGKAKFEELLKSEEKLGGYAGVLQATRLLVRVHCRPPKDACNAGVVVACGALLMVMLLSVCRSATLSIW
jgi:hypothetical protein